MFLLEKLLCLFIIDAVIYGRVDATILCNCNQAVFRLLAVQFSHNNQIPQEGGTVTLFYKVNYSSMFLVESTFT